MAKFIVKVKDRYAESLINYIEGHIGVEDVRTKEPASTKIDQEKAMVKNEAEEKEREEDTGEESEKDSEDQEETQEEPREEEEETETNEEEKSEEE